MDAWRTALIVAGSVVGAGVVLWPLGIWWEVRKCEKPSYTVIRPLGRRRSPFTGRSPAELRQYAPMLLAEVAVSGTMREASSAGFRAIAGFIFGGNTAPTGSGSESVAMTSPVRMEIEDSSSSKSSSKSGSAKIAMTSPVRMDMAGSEGLAPEQSGQMRMSFVMPSKYTAATLPRPNNPDVVIREVPGHLTAVLQFRGHIRGRALVQQKKAELLALLDSEGLVPVGSLILNQYHPPFTFGWQRVNEVAFEVREKAS